MLGLTGKDLQEEHVLKLKEKPHPEINQAEIDHFNQKTPRSEVEMQEIKLNGITNYRRKFIQKKIQKWKIIKS